MPKARYEVRLSTYGEARLKWYSFKTAKEAVKFVLKELHETQFSLGGYTFEEKFEELIWIDKGRIVQMSCPPWGIESPFLSPTNLLGVQNQDGSSIWRLLQGYMPRTCGDQVRKFFSREFFSARVRAKMSIILVLTLPSIFCILGEQREGDSYEKYSKRDYTRLSGSKGRSVSIRLRLPTRT